MKMMKFLGCAAALAAFGAYADGFTAKFEEFQGTLGAAMDNWLGDAWVTNTAASTTTATVGVPGGQTETTDDKYRVLQVEGTVTNATMFADMAVNTKSQVDMMVKVAYPDEELALPSGETGVQIAVGIGTDGRLNVYCTKADATQGFVPVSDPIDSNTWVRVSFDFDYANGKCQVLLDGSPVASTTAGYATAAATKVATADGGSWFKLATTPATKVISSMKVVGTTAIDDVYTSQNTSGSAVVIPDTAVVKATDGTEVKKSWLVEQGVSTNKLNEALADGSGMTAAQKYATGLDCNDGETFRIKDMQPVSATQIKITFPGTAGTGAVTNYKVMLADAATGELTASGADAITDGTQKVDGDNVVTLNLADLVPDGKTVRYIKVQTNYSAE